MTRRLAAAVASLAGLVLVAGCASGTAMPASSSATGGSTSTTASLPAVTLPALEKGRPLDLGALHGPAIVNLWASWCGPCRQELPQYAAFARRYAGKVSVIGIDYQETRDADALELARKAGVGYPLYADHDGQLHALGLPELVLVDAHGRVAHREFGRITSVAQLAALVQQHLGVAL